jgi:carbon-monoxide dehydrogenase large subunit
MAVKMMGAQVKRKEDPRLITGASITGDISLPGLHYVAFVRSPHAHARIRRIDASAVLKRPGVVAVVTGADLKPHCGPVPVDQASTEGGEGQAAIGRKHYPLAIDRVRHVGEAVAAVIAATEELAVDAAAEVVVDWNCPRVNGLRPEARRPQVHADAPTT